MINVVIEITDEAGHNLKRIILCNVLDRHQIVSSAIEKIFEDKEKIENLEFDEDYNFSCKGYYGKIEFFDTICI